MSWRPFIVLRCPPESTFAARQELLMNASSASGGLAAMALPQGYDLQIILPEAMAAQAVSDGLAALSTWPIEVKP